MKKRIGFFLSLLVMVTLACNLSRSPTTQAPGETPQGNGNQPGNTSPQPVETLPSPQPKGTPPASPVSINDGLGSLNSYDMTINLKSIGPDPSISSTTVMEEKRSQDQDARYTHIIQTSVTKPGAKPDTTESDTYQIGNDECSGSGKDWSWTTMLPNQTEMFELSKNMLSLTPLIDHPTFVAQETVNGIPSNHFTFKVSGLGAKSGAIVNANQGDYWLAVDGQYIVKYTLVMETSMDPKTIQHEEIAIDVNQVNQPVDIAFPKACITASKVTPTP